MTIEEKKERVKKHSFPRIPPVASPEPTLTPPAGWRTMTFEEKKAWLIEHTPPTPEPTLNPPEVWRGELNASLKPCIEPTTAKEYMERITDAIQQGTYVLFPHYIPATQCVVFANGDEVTGIYGFGTVNRQGIECITEIIPVYGEMVDLIEIKFNDDYSIRAYYDCVPEEFDKDIGLFGGEWLNARPRAEVMVVHDEPTAVFANLAYPEYVWVAVGIGRRLCSQHLYMLEDRTFYLVPSADDVEKAGWLDIAIDWWGWEYYDDHIFDDYMEMTGAEMMAKLKAMTKR